MGYIYLIIQRNTMETIIRQQNFTKYPTLYLIPTKIHILILFVCRNFTDPLSSTLSKVVPIWNIITMRYSIIRWSERTSGDDLSKLINSECNSLLVRNGFLIVSKTVFCTEFYSHCMHKKWKKVVLRAKFTIVFRLRPDSLFLKAWKPKFRELYWHFCCI